MSKDLIINTIANLIEAKSYLEIGVEEGFTFKKIDTINKYAVDPVFRFELRGLKGSFHEKSSDTFFQEIPRETKFDIILIDGMHTYEQSLRDLLNALHHLDRGGVVILDDVYPSDYISALKDHSKAVKLKELTGKADRDWMGDVYRTIAFVHDYLPMLQYATTSIRPNLAIIWASNKITRVPAFNTVHAISEFTFADLQEKIDILNLRPLDEILEEILRTRAG